ncbi:hypothetical protein FGO68_gene13656 [Halteria grandinella]|uniref:Cysteine protease n=1 Tax=Halteria grandinella TaxID=5974 RepID=A0A8J8NS78_HALGN|nr:hypothetical protein FGO68_gene13656 [Halteria grandinella]
MKRIENLTQDSGWGCTIRSAQMLIGNTLLFKHFEKDYPRELILKLFDDSSRGIQESTFSIQNVCYQALESQGKVPGEWFGVGAMTKILEELNDRFHPVQNFEICVFDENLIGQRILGKGLAQVDEMCSSQFSFEQQSMSFDFKSTRFNQSQPQLGQAQEMTWKNSVLVIINLRLGAELIQPEYAKVLTRYIKLPWFTGFIGGQPGKAFFFLGSNEKELIFLDPHLVQTYRPFSTENIEKIIDNSIPYKISTKVENFGVRVINPDKLDPGVGLSFYIKSEEDYIMLIETLKGMSIEDGENAIFQVFQTEAEMNEALELGQSKLSIRSFSTFSQIKH